MASVKEIELGPIVGHTTVCSARLWGAISPDTAENLNSDSEKFNVGVLRWWPEGEPENALIARFRFNGNFHYSGALVLSKLDRSPCYEYQMGYVEDERCLDELEQLVWDDVVVRRFNTAPDRQEILHFAMGSCMYPKFMAFRWRNGKPLSRLDKRTDKIFKAVYQRHEQTPLDFILLLGDQIYADALGPLWPATSEEKFQHIYSKAFSQPHFSKAASHIPLYMAFDDHEVHNDFTEGLDEYSRKHPERTDNAMNALYAHQLIYTPVFDKVVSENEYVAYIKGQGDHELPTRHWYDIDRGFARFFICDTRAQREPNKMLDNEQFEALLEWLKKDPEKIKFVASGTTVIVDADTPGTGKPDNWARAKHQRQQLIDCIVGEGIKNVFFLSGDVHAHFAAQLTVNGEPYPVYQLVSSGIFWPTLWPISNFKWKEEWVDFENISGTAPDKAYGLKGPLKDQDSKKGYFEGNGMAFVKLDSDQLQFTVVNRADFQEILKVSLDLRLG